MIEMAAVMNVVVSISFFIDFLLVVVDISITRFSKYTIILISKPKLFRLLKSPAMG